MSLLSGLIGALLLSFIVILLLWGLLVKKGNDDDKILQESQKELSELRNSYSKLLNQKKSSEVRLGKIGENFAPFIRDWPYDPNNFRFIGNPIDGIQFNDDEIIFVEIKTGNSRLSKSQKSFRDIIKSGNVRFATFRVNENGSMLNLLEE